MKAVFAARFHFVNAAERLRIAWCKQPQIVQREISHTAKPRMPSVAQLCQETAVKMENRSVPSDLIDANMRQSWFEFITVSSPVAL